MERCIECRWATTSEGPACMFTYHFKYPGVEFPNKITPKTRPPKGVNCFKKDSPELHQMKVFVPGEGNSVVQVGTFDTSNIEWKE